jgi:hypothetical protein
MNLSGLQFICAAAPAAAPVCHTRPGVAHVDYTSKRLYLARAAPTLWLAPIAARFERLELAA